MYTNIIPVNENITLVTKKTLPSFKGIHKIKINNAVRGEKNVGQRLRAYLESKEKTQSTRKQPEDIIDLSQSLSTIIERNDDDLSTHSGKSIVDELSIKKKDVKPRVNSNTFNYRKFANIILLHRKQNQAWIKKITHCLNKTNNTKKMKKQKENQRLKKDKINKQEKLKNPDSVIQKQHKDRVKNLHFITNQLTSQQKQIEQLNRNNTAQQQIIQRQEGVIQNFQQKQRDYEEQIKKLLNTNKFIAKVNKYILDKDLPYKQDYNKRVLKKINKEYNLFNTTNYSQTNPIFYSTI